MVREDGRDTRSSSPQYAGKIGDKMHIDAAPDYWLQPGRMHLQRREDDSRSVHGIRRGCVHVRYPNQEAGIVLHEERYKVDNTTRYAAQLGINRTNIETGRRLDKGPARQAAKVRVATIRKLDARYGLRQMERRKSSSRLHGKQPGCAERDMARKRQASRSENGCVRAIVTRRIDEVGRIPRCHDRIGELARRLAKDGITLSRSKNGSLQYRFYSKSLRDMREVNGVRLGFARNARTGKITRFTVQGIKAAMNNFIREMLNKWGGVMILGRVNYRAKRFRATESISCLPKTLFIYSLSLILLMPSDIALRFLFTVCIWLLSLSIVTFIS